MTPLEQNSPENQARLNKLTSYRVEFQFRESKDIK